MSSSTTFKTGGMAVRWSNFAGGQVTGKVHAAAAGALHLAAEFLLEHANRTVPLDEGTLQRSGHADVDPARLVAAVSYDTPYAARQHEATHYSHGPGRRAKWLEATTREQAHAVGAFMAGKMRQALR